MDPSISPEFSNERAAPDRDAKIAAIFRAISIIVGGAADLERRLRQAATEEAEDGNHIGWHLLDTLAQCCAGAPARWLPPQNYPSR